MKKTDIVAGLAKRLFSAILIAIKETLRSLGIVAILVCICFLTGLGVKLMWGYEVKEPEIDFLVGFAVWIVVMLVFLTYTWIKENISDIKYQEDVKKAIEKWEKSQHTDEKQ